MCKFFLVKQKIFILFIFSMVVQSCVPLKKLIYLQEDKTTIEKQQQTIYRFKKGDRIVIDIQTRDEALNKLFGTTKTTNNYSGENIYFLGYEVDHEGFITLPVLGKIQAMGKSPEELKKTILEKLLATQINHPQDVFVKVKPAGIQVTLLGEVNSPGTHLILKPEPNILEAIARSGDITLTGNRQEVMVIREKENGAKTIKQIDLTRKDALNSEVFYLKNNDIIYVKPLPQKTIGTGTTLISTLTTLMSITSFAISVYLFTKSR